MADFTPDQRAKIEAFARSLIEGEPADLRTQAQESNRRRVERAVRETVHRLSAMQRTAVIEYLSGKGKTEAAAVAGYANPEKQQARVFANPAVQAVIDEFFHVQEMGAKEVIARLSQQARAEYADYLTAAGSVDLAGMLAEGKGHLIKGFKQTQFGLNVEFYDAHQALALVGRYHGLFGDRIRIEDWQADIVGLLKNNRLSPADVRAAYPDLAAQLFARAGIDANRND